MTSATELFSTIGETKTGAVIDRVFRQMDVAEWEIKDAQERHPERADEIFGAFRQLQPTEPIKNKSTELYSHHCFELLERVAKGKSTTPATKAEILGFLVDLSLERPMTSPQEYLYWSLVWELQIGTDELKELAKHHIMHSESLNPYWKEDAEELGRYLRLHVNQEERPKNESEGG